MRGRPTAAGLGQHAGRARLSMIISAFTVIPAVLTIAGLVLAVRDVSRWRRARTAERSR